MILKRVRQRTGTGSAGPTGAAGQGAAGARVASPPTSATQPCAAAGGRGETSLCANLATHCTRPAGAFHLAIRSTGSYVIAKNTLDSL